MQPMMEFIFWISLFMIIYPYLIYPILLNILTALFGKNKDLAEKKQDWPSVSFMISAYNEADVIAEKLQNALDLDYPQDRMNIFVVSDASDDGTDEIVREWSEKDPRIRLVRQEKRRGKSAGLNLGVRQTEGEIIVFSDANAMFEKNAIYELVKYFENPKVGYVIGAALYNKDRGNQASESEGLYWKFELYIKKIESRFYSVVGGDGAIYAIRRHLHWDLDDDDINDFVNPLQIVANGYRGIFNPRAICYEDAAGDFAKEFKRKRRIVNRSYRALLKYIGWFKFWRDFRFLFELFSHKVIRWFSFHFVGLMFGANIWLVLGDVSLFYQLTLAGLIAFLLMGLIGYKLESRNKNQPKLIYLAYYYLLVNFAAFLGILDAHKGQTYTTWDHVRNPNAT